MDNAALIRLRVGFVALAAALLVPLFLLLREAQTRLEEQRRLRHEIVAERVFDELERELTTLLEAERMRPSSAYDAASTRITTWAPFVVGYFTRDKRALHLLAAEQLPSPRRKRVENAVASLWQSGPPPFVDQDAEDRLERDARSKSKKTLEEAAGAPREAKQDYVLRQLNRASKQRAPAAKSSQSAPANPKNLDDPLMGL